MVECDAGNRAGSVAPDAGQRQQLLHALGNFSTEPRDDFLRGSMQVPRACIVPRAFPCFEHVVERRDGQSADGWKTREETPIIGDDCGDLGLLQQCLGNPNAVWVVRVAPPGEIALVFSVP